jgi:hypothetical protein
MLGFARAGTGHIVGNPTFHCQSGQVGRQLNDFAVPLKSQRFDVFVVVQEIKNKIVEGITVSPMQFKEPKVLKL